MSADRIAIVHAGDGADALAAVLADDGAGDVAVVMDGIEPPEGWAERMAREADEAVTASVSCVAFPGGAAIRARRLSELGQPRILDRPLPTCVVLPRAAIELAGPPRGQHRSVEALLSVFAERCTKRGLMHLVSTAVVAGAAAPVPPKADERAPLGHAVVWARRLAGPLRVTIDARSLTGGGAGTQVRTLELIGAVARRSALRVRVVLPEHPTDDVLRPLAGLPDLECGTYEEIEASAPVSDVVHRPYPVFAVTELLALQRLGRRVIVTQLDQLLHRNPIYFPDEEAWREFRETSRYSLSWADRVVFFTRHARDEALRDELIEPSQAAVVPIGTDHTLLHGGLEARRPEAVEGEGRFLLALGSDLAHKNRPFAIKLLRALRERHDWAGGLVMAGPRARLGSLRAEEDALLAHSDLPVVRTDRVSESERRWLLERCDAVVFPSIGEGFGLLPFEAGAVRRPCLFAPVGSLRELFPARAATLVPWDEDASAAAALPLLEAGPARDRHVALLREGAAAYRWETTGERLEGLYEDVLSSTPRAVPRQGGGTRGWIHG